MATEVTARQARVWLFIHEHRESKGYAPSMREVAAALGFVSTNAVSDHMKALERKGFLRRTTHISRAVVTTGDAVKMRARAGDAPQTP